MKKAKTAEFKIKELSKSYELYPRLVWRLQVAVVQSVALYRSELWW